MLVAFGGDLFALLTRLSADALHIFSCLSFYGIFMDVEDILAAVSVQGGLRHDLGGLHIYIYILV